MKRHRPKLKFGKKVTCGCPHKKKAYCELLDEAGRATGGGKCWSHKCGQKFSPPQPSHPANDKLPTAQTVAPQQRRPNTDQYVYTDALGNNVRRVNITRRPDGTKSVWLEHWTGETYVNGAGTEPKLLYRLPEVSQQLQKGGTIYITEGEKDVETAYRHGLVATCNLGGAGKWTDELSESLKGASSVIIIADNDEPGRKHAKDVYESLKRAGIRDVKILDLLTVMPNLPHKGDLTDYVERGGKVEDLQRAIEEPAASTGESNAIAVHEPPEINLAALPRGVRGLIDLVADRHQKIALLFSVITVVAAILPGVRFRYFTKRLSAVLYFFVVGPPGSGKSIIELARLLITPIQKALEEQSADEIKAYKAARAEWERSEGRGEEPEKPKRSTLLLPADSTAPTLIRSICENRNALIFDTEADSIQSAIGRDYGDFSSALRKNWQGEPVSQARVRDDLFVSTDDPHLCVVISGTPDQIPVLAKHSQNGLTSRICFLVFPPQQSFRNPFDTGNQTVLEYARAYSTLVLKIWQEVKAATANGEILFELTTDQQVAFRQHFGGIISDLEDDSDRGTTLRAGVVAMRIILVLTVLRYSDEGRELTGTLIACDDDFHIGIALSEHLRLQSEYVVKTFLSHGASTATSTVEEKHRNWYDQLPTEFTTKDAIKLAQQCGFGKSTAYSLLHLHHGIEKVGHGRYRKCEINCGRGP